MEGWRGHAGGVEIECVINPSDFQIFPFLICQ